MNREKKNRFTCSMYICIIVVLSITFFVGVMVTMKAKKEVRTIEKNEMTNITYEIILNNNDVYTQKEDYDFAPNLVDKINVNFEYYNDNNPQKYVLSAYIATYVKAVSLDGFATNAVIDSVQTIKNKEPVTDDSTNITFSIDYKQYVTKLNNYITNENLSSESSGKLELILIADNEENDISNKAQVSISLLEDSVSVDINKTIRNVSSTLLGNNADLFLAITILSLLLDIAAVIGFYFYNKLSKMDNYHRQLYKIFKLYKSILIKSDLSNVEKETLIKVDSFKELIKVHNSVSLPVIYNKNEDNCEFLIKVGKSGYYYKLVNKE